jgi:branched-chain amino acid transport system substrate-binding protein
MKTMWLAGVALGASLAFARHGRRPRTFTIGVAGPMTGQYASFGTHSRTRGRAVADINAAAA